MPTDLHVAFDTLRGRLQAELDTHLSTFRTALDSDSSEREPPVTAPSALSRLAAALRSMSTASSLTAILDGVADAAAAEAPRTALHLVAEGPGVQGVALTRWRSSGFHDVSDEPLLEVIEEAVRTRETTRTHSVQSGAEPDAAPGRPGVVVPLLVGNRAVALLYGEGEIEGSGAGWPAALQILAAHGSACLSHVTAMRWAQASAGGAPVPSTNTGHDESARRYARLLVSEIKLYNETAVRAGRDGRDLLLRLGPEIARARALYEARVPASGGDRATLFQQELVETLAGGDASLLGVPA